MKNKLFFFLAILLFAFLSIGLAKNASAQNLIFISMLSKIPGYKIAKDYGFITYGKHESNQVLIREIKGQKPIIQWIYNTSQGNMVMRTFGDIEQYTPSGSNACIDLSFRRGFYAACEYVKLVPEK